MKESLSRAFTRPMRAFQRLPEYEQERHVMITLKSFPFRRYCIRTRPRCRGGIISELVIEPTVTLRQVTDGPILMRMMINAGIFIVSTFKPFTLISPKSFSGEFSPDILEIFVLVFAVLSPWNF